MKMSSRLSSSVKRDSMLQPPETMLDVVVRTGEATDYSELEKFVHENGGEIVNSHQRAAVSIRLPNEAIGDLADEPGILYIDTGGKFAP